MQLTALQEGPGRRTAPSSVGDSFSAQQTLGHGMSIGRRVCRIG
jgi:hypothetical protein